MGRLQNRRPFFIPFPHPSTSQPRPSHTSFQNYLTLQSHALQKANPIIVITVTIIASKYNNPIASPFSADNHTAC
jgi:hypothetical protein